MYHLYTGSDGALFHSAEMYSCKSSAYIGLSGEITKVAASKVRPKMGRGSSTTDVVFLRQMMV